MFNQARLKLTLWYTMIIVAISGSLSLLFYLQTAATLDQQFALIEQRLHQERMGLGLTSRQMATLRILPEEIAEAKHKIIRQLLLINGGIGVIIATAGYFLSGKTLKPIQMALEDQKRFVGDAAHELKTPVTALKTSIEVNLMDENLPDQVRTVLKENLEDVNRMQSLAESLLLLAKQDNQLDDHAIIFEKCSVIQLRDNAIRQVRVLAEQKRTELKVGGSIEELMIEGKCESLTQLLVILLDNAIKYSPEHSTVTLSIYRNKSDLIIQVQDYGIGIAKHHLPYIFDRFYRVDSARSKGESGGYGLGLAVAKKIIEQHHGQIQVESEVDKGTIFNIKLPLTQPR